MTGGQVRCPKCGFDNEPAADICASCLEPMPRAPAPPPAPRHTGAFLLFGIALALAAGGAGFLLREAGPPTSMPAPRSAPAPVKTEPPLPDAPAPVAADVQPSADSPRDKKVPPPAPPKSPADEKDQLRARFKEESQSGVPHAPLTNEDMKLLAKNPTERLAPVQRRDVLVPPPVATGSMSLVSAQINGNQARLRIIYSIGAAHTRAVYAAARVYCSEPDLSFFSYGTTPLSHAGGETTVVVNLGTISPVYPSRVRLMLFESRGAMFYSTEIPWP